MREPISMASSLAIPGSPGDERLDEPADERRRILNETYLTDEAGGRGGFLPEGSVCLTIACSKR